MSVRRYRIAREAVASESIKSREVKREHIAPGAVGRAETDELFLQTGATSVSIPFAVVGVERVSVSVTFPEAFPAGVVPRVIAIHNQADIHTCGITAVSATGFTIVFSDTAGVDKTAAVSAILYWVAVAP